MLTYTVSFFGHRQIENIPETEKRLEALICPLLREKGFVEFLVGRDGEFDQIVSSTVRRCKRAIRDDNSALVWVMPYPTQALRHNEGSFRAYYDEIEICADATGQHFKKAHQIRNRCMIDRSDLVIFCVDRESGGAWQAMKYAKGKSVPWVNIGKISGPIE